MPSLEDTLAKTFAPIVAELARKTAEALRAMSVEEVLALSGLERRGVTRRDRIRRSRTAKAATTGKTSDILAKLVPMLKAAGADGVSGEAIQKELGLDRNSWRSVMRAGLASGALRKKGEKRATRYYAGAQKAESPSTSSRKRSGRRGSK